MEQNRLQTAKRKAGNNGYQNAGDGDTPVAPRYTSVYMSVMENREF